MIADPAFVGATHESDTCESPAVVVGTEIAAGGVSGVIAVEAGEKQLLIEPLNIRFSEDDLALR